MKRAAIVIGLCIATCAFGQDVVLDRRVVNFNELTWGGDRWIGEIESLGDAALRESYLAGTAGDAAMPSEHYWRLYVASAVWQETDSEAHRDMAVRLCHVMLGDLIDANDAALRTLPDADRGFARESRMARDAATRWGFVLLTTVSVRVLDGPSLGRAMRASL
jgi:hypothetical protein